MGSTVSVIVQPSRQATVGVERHTSRYTVSRAVPPDGGHRWPPSGAYAAQPTAAAISPTASPAASSRPAASDPDYTLDHHETLLAERVGVLWLLWRAIHAGRRAVAR